MNQAEAIQQVEKMLDFDLSGYNRGGCNLVDAEANKQRYLSQLPTIPWESFVQSADYSYFVARTLLTQFVTLYGWFCAHQCVEGYLKAFLQKVGVHIPQHHVLNKLLLECQKAHTDVGSFFRSTHAATICKMYEPFYEMARYPVQIKRPVDGKYMWMSGKDEKTLDYFVYKMRRILPMPSRGWDILTAEGHNELMLVKVERADFYRLFTDGNLNFLP